MKEILHSLLRGETGEIQQGPLVFVSMLILVGALTITPLLGYMGTGLKTGEMHEEMTQELYGADSGVEDAFLWLQNGRATDGPWQPDGEGQWTRTAYEMNDKTVDVAVEEDIGNYMITSTATSADGESTTIEAYVVSIDAAGLGIFLSGALASSGNIDLGKDSSVSGDIYIGGELTVGLNFTHEDGEVILSDTGDFPTQEQNEVFAQMFKNEAILGGTYPGSIIIDTDIDMGPKYIAGDVYITEEVTINLTGTVYVEGTITAQKDYTVTGSGSIVAVGEIYVSKLADYGIDGDSIIMSVNSNIIFKKEVIVEALVYAPNGIIRFDKSATVMGGVVGAGIQADKQGSFTYVPRSNPIEFPGCTSGGYTLQSYDIS